jgi:hypothetical protein
MIATAFSIPLFTESTLQSGIFLKKMPRSMLSKRQHVDRKCSGRIPLLALAAFSLGAAATLPAQQPASPTHGNSATQQQGKPQANSAPAPQGNLIIQVMDSNGTPFPGAQLEVDGMRTGAAPPGSAPPAPARADSAPASSAPTVGPEIPCPKSSSAQSAGAPRGGAQADGGQAGSGQTGQAGSAPADKAPPGDSQPKAGQTQGQTHDGVQPRSSQHCYLPPGSVLPGTAQSIGNLIGSAPGGGVPSLPPGAVPLTTDAQGQLVLQLPNGEHSVSVTVYGFEPFTGHFTLSGKHRQMVQIKLSSSPPTYVFVVGPDSRVQLETPEVDALIPLEPLQTLGPLAPRARRRLL